MGIVTLELSIKIAIFVLGILVCMKSSALVSVKLGVTDFNSVSDFFEEVSRDEELVSFVRDILDLRLIHCN